MFKKMSLACLQFGSAYTRQYYHAKKMIFLIKMSYIWCFCVARLLSQISYSMSIFDCFISTLVWPIDFEIFALQTDCEYSHSAGPNVNMLDADVCWKTHQSDHANQRSPWTWKHSLGMTFLTYDHFSNINRSLTDPKNPQEANEPTNAIEMS